jgi:uncharacterized membrane protein (DUF485 family)
MATRVREIEQTAPTQARQVDLSYGVDDTALEALAARRWRVSLGFTVAMLVVYFGFILLIAFAKDFMGRTITDGLTVGMALGVLVILATWALTWTYVLWANRVYEPALARLRR